MIDLLNTDKSEYEEEIRQLKKERAQNKVTIQEKTE